MDLYGLYVNCRRDFYDGVPSSHSTYLIGVDVSEDRLKQRWNEAQPLERWGSDIKWEEELPRWPGSTGGGCLSVDYWLELKIVEQDI